MKREHTGGDAELIFDAGHSDDQAHVDVYLDSPYFTEATARVRFTRSEFARVLLHGVVVLIRSL